MPSNVDGDVTKSYRMNTHLCLNVFCVGWHLAVTFVAFLLWIDEESFGLRVIKFYERVMRGMVP